MIKVILYDLDGTLADATEIHYESLNRALREISDYSISRQDHEVIYNGLPTKIKLDILVKIGTISTIDVPKIWKLKQIYTLEVIKEIATIDIIKQELHEYTYSLGCISGCVTNSIRETATLLLEKTGQLQYINFLVANEDTIKNKPDPEPYLFAMKSFNVLPEHTLILEDSDHGWESAINSKANVLRVKNSHEVTARLLKDYL